MKLFSLFTKAPQYQRFKYSPRFYDPQKEEMEERERRIKRELEREKGQAIDESIVHRTRIAGSFQAARKRSTESSSGAKATMIRLFVLLFLTIFIIAYLEWGQAALFLLLLFVPFYFYLKFKRK